METLMIRVMLADDETVLREGGKLMISIPNEIEVIHTCSNLHMIKKEFYESGADVLVIDIRFSGEKSNGIELCDEMLKENPNIKIIAYTQFDYEWAITDSYKFGVKAFIKKDDSIEELQKAIKLAHEGKKYMNQEIGLKILEIQEKQKENMSLNPKLILNERELQVFKLIAMGKTKKEVESEISIAYRLVALAIESIKEKLDLRTDADIARLAIKYKIINLDKEES